jgi:hypothetical protein
VTAPSGECPSPRKKSVRERMDPVNKGLGPVMGGRRRMTVAFVAAAVSLWFTVGFIVGVGVTHPIDDNSKDVLVAGIGGLLGLLTGVSVAVIGLRNSRTADRERFDREDRYRFAADRQTAYSKLRSTGDLARAAVGAAGRQQTDQQLVLASDRVDEMSAAQDVTALLGSATVNTAASEYVNAIIEFYNMTINIPDLAPAERLTAVAAGSPWAKSHEIVMRKRSRVLRTMRQDLLA